VQCEICGRTIRGEPYRRVVEGVKLLVCASCSKLGSLDWSVGKSPIQKGFGVDRSPSKPITVSIIEKRAPAKITKDYEFVKGHNALIQKVRLKAGLSYEDLGRKIGEKVSVLKKVEGGKITPDYRLTRKLENALHVRLLEVSSEEKTDVSAPAPKPVNITIGDIVQIKTDKKEEFKERRQS